MDCFAALAMTVLGPAAGAIGPAALSPDYRPLALRQAAKSIFVCSSVAG